MGALMYQPPDGGFQMPQIPDLSPYFGGSAQDNGSAIGRDLGGLVGMGAQGAAVGGGIGGFMGDVASTVGGMFSGGGRGGDFNPFIMSDRSLKQDIEPITSALDLLARL